MRSSTGSRPSARSTSCLDLAATSFVVLVSEPNGKGPATFERALRTAIAAFNDTCTRLYRLSVSIGWTEFDFAAPRTIDQLLTTADAQMYTAKRARQDRGGVSLPPPNSKA